jgi:hypothetical protein
MIYDYTLEEKPGRAHGTPAMTYTSPTPIQTMLLAKSYT